MRRNLKTSTSFSSLCAITIAMALCAGVMIPSLALAADSKEKTLLNEAAPANSFNSILRLNDGSTLPVSASWQQNNNEVLIVLNADSKTTFPAATAISNKKLVNTKFRAATDDEILLALREIEKRMDRDLGNTHLVEPTKTKASNGSEARTIQLGFKFTFRVKSPKNALNTQLIDKLIRG
jgi:hypothetical protein